MDILPGLLSLSQWLDEKGKTIKRNARDLPGLLASLEQDVQRGAAAGKSAWDASRSVMPGVREAGIREMNAQGQELGGLLGPISAKQAKKIIKHTKEHGGATYDPATDTFEKSGYAVAKLPPAATIGNAPVPQVKLDITSPRAIADLQEFERKNAGLLANGGKIGTWYDSKTGQVIIDPSEVVGSRFRGILEGNRRQQDAIFDLKRGEEIRGDPYRTPTYTSAEGMPSYSMNIPVSSERTAWTAGRPTVRNAQRVSRPGVYDDPRKITNDSAALIGPEDPLLYQIFNVHRPDLDVMAMQAQDPSIINPLLHRPTRSPKYVEDVTTKRNAQRLQDVIGLALEDPRYAGMPGWYVTQPLYQKFLQYMSPEEARTAYLRHHLYASPMSAMNSVDKEIAKGSFAELIDAEGKATDFFDRLLLPPGIDHPAHATAHGAGMRNLIDSGGTRFWKEVGASPKTPNYYYSKIGENWRMPTGDAHFVRAVGLPDVRPMVKNKKGLLVPDDSSIGNTEAYPVGEWFYNSVSEPLGLTGNIGQPTLWGAMASRTGVDTTIGAPYLELLATQIGKAAKRQGVTPEEAFRRYALKMGRESYLGRIDPELLGLLGAGSAGAAGVAYGMRE